MLPFTLDEISCGAGICLSPGTLSSEGAAKPALHRPVRPFARPRRWQWRPASLRASARPAIQYLQKVVHLHLRHRRHSRLGHEHKAARHRDRRGGQENKPAAFARDVVNMLARQKGQYVDPVLAAAEPARHHAHARKIALRAVAALGRQAHHPRNGVIDRADEGQRG